jgi:hypothetical protein
MGTTPRPSHTAHPPDPADVHTKSPGSVHSLWIKVCVLWTINHSLWMPGTTRSGVASGGRAAVEIASRRHIPPSSAQETPGQENSAGQEVCLIRLVSSAIWL